jgi:hypothetical protein
MAADDDGRYVGRPLTEEALNDLAVQALVAMRVDDLRAGVLALEEHIVERGELWVRRADVLALIGGAE